MNRDRFADAVLLAVLAVDGAVLGLLGLLFNPLYAGAVPVPIGALVSVLVLPWLVARAYEVDPRTWTALAPLAAWAVVVGLAALPGPGGDIVLPATWQSLLLFAGGLAAGLYGLRRVQG